ncbi:MAG TPA: Yip1 family protein [Pyrinomonadaceae bacterium]|nr:Yip1 family protein [Pyrinomonadaceae bacterium]
MNEQNSAEFEPPPPPPTPEEPREEPQMSEAGTMGNIFLEPENTFKDLRRKPRFIIAGIIIAILVMAYTFGVQMKVGEAGLRSFMSEQIDKSPQGDSLSKEQKGNAIDLQMKISKYTTYALPIFVFISFLIGGLLYWAGAKAFGGTGTFTQNLSVWIYSGFPPAVVGMVANFIVLALKSADDIDLATSQRGLLHANLGFFVGKEHAVISTILSTFDVFAIWGWILAAIGLSVVNKMSKASAWTLVLLITLVGLGFRLIGALLSGNPS